MTDRQVWEQALAELRIQMTRVTYEHCFENSVAEYNNKTDTIVICVRDKNVSDWLAWKWTKPVKRLVSGILGREINIIFEGGK